MDKPNLDVDQLLKLLGLERYQSAQAVIALGAALERIQELEAALAAKELPPENG